MATKRDYYEVLGVSKTATKDEIRSAYRKLAKKYHPDINHDPDAPKMFEEVQEAYDVLSDDTKRAQYDQFGQAAFEQGASTGGPARSARGSPRPDSATSTSATSSPPSSGEGAVSSRLGHHPGPGRARTS